MDIQATIVVRANWDDEAGVWVASSKDVQGLAVESETLEELRGKVLDALADLIELNGLARDVPDIPVCIMAEQLGRVRVPCA